MDQLAIDALELLTISAYAYLLDKHKWRWEPEWTVAEVGIGSAICLGFGRLRRSTRTNPTAATQWADDCRSFLVGGTPITLWQLRRNQAIQINGLRQQLAYLMRRHGGV